MWPTASLSTNDHEIYGLKKKLDPTFTLFPTLHGDTKKEKKTWNPNKSPLPKNIKFLVVCGSCAEKTRGRRYPKDGPRSDSLPQKKEAEDRTLSFLGFLKNGINLDLERIETI